MLHRPFRSHRGRLASTQTHRYPGKEPRSTCVSAGGGRLGFSPCVRGGVYRSRSGEHTPPNDETNPCDKQTPHHVEAMPCAVVELERGERLYVRECVCCSIVLHCTVLYLILYCINLYLVWYQVGQCITQLRASTNEVLVLLIYMWHVHDGVHGSPALLLKFEILTA